MDVEEHNLERLTKDSKLRKERERNQNTGTGARKVYLAPAQPEHKRCCNKIGSVMDLQYVALCRLG